MMTSPSSSSPSSSRPQPQQQQLFEENYDREEEYTQAQRAAVEAVHVGRETLQQSVQQEEQLNRALAMGDETEYKLDKAGRILRGMTWSGWVANMFTKPVGPLPTTDGGTTTGGVSSSMRKAVVPAVYDNVIPECQAVAQAIQNYHANVSVMEKCETEEQKQTLQLICDTMYENARTALEELRTHHPQLDAYHLQFQNDLQTLQKRQQSIQEITRQLGTLSAPMSASYSQGGGSGADPNRAELFSSVSTTNQTQQQQPKIHPVQRQQDEHLAVMAQSLGELGSIAKNLHQSIGQQTNVIDSLDSRTDNITEKSRMVTRRADRMVQKKSWTPVKATFSHHASIRHIASGRYLAALDATSLYLVPRFHRETCVFGVWKRQGQVFGLQNQHSGKWAGQSVFGSLACSASSFGRREEWEMSGGDRDENDWSKTRLLCCSAGWGAGGYLMVNPKDFALSIGGCTVEERHKADLWAILPQEQPQPTRRS